ncbi:hypothetical protein PENFLA_c080G07693 [Penicillium flavigenum]|uniref:Reverse transcriptase domain-containing protein n=1 Tax=Penicillium flavigenum TaxID=254877 RepID=A0A1V6SAU8_9EURO|nr:hypothetical protein PENFLA_c080G07693 [Penicillium flavigenum]
MNTPYDSLPTSTPLELPWQPITELEIQRSLKAAKGTTAPGDDNLPMLVWKQLWRNAKIVVLRKPGKPDYSVPGAYRPISLLNTLSKLLEAVVALLLNAIDRAWYKNKVVTLVSFDLKGAFNGVNQTSLDACLRAGRIPVVVRKWIASFISDRYTSIGFDDFRTELAPLANAGLAQGSPLSPILFTFFNSDLVDQPVTFHGGVSAFIDDYFRWRVGCSAEENLAKIQSEDIPRIETTSLIRILSAFRTVATTTLEVEAHVLPTRLRLRHRAQRTIASFHTLPRDHPIWSALLRAQKRRNNIGSYARFPLAEAIKTMNIERLNELETIDPRPLPLWRLDPFAEIEIGSDREIAAQKAETTRSTSDVVAYSDASSRQDHLGAAAVALDNNQEILEAQQVQVGPMSRWSVHVAELIGIFYAISVVFKIAHQHLRIADRQLTATILCDRHYDNPGNDAADRLAKDAASPGKTHPFYPLLTRERAFIRRNIYSQWEQEWKSSTKGGHLRKIDNTLPASYTRRLYGNLPRNRAYLLTQLRTGHNWLSSYRKNVSYSDDDQCVCGAQETVTHVLVDCPNLREPRRELRREVGDAFNSVSSLLGGSK